MGNAELSEKKDKKTGNYTYIISVLNKRFLK